MFSFHDPAIRAGWWFGPSGTGALSAHSAGIADWLQGLDLEFGIIDTTDWHQSPVPLDRSLITAAWLQDRLKNKGWFRVERSWPPDAVPTTAPVIELLADLAESLLTDSVLLDGLEADGTLDRSQSAAPPVEGGGGPNQVDAVSECDVPDTGDDQANDAPA